MKKLLFIAVALLIIAACSNAPTERVVTVNNPDFSGFAAKYLEVVDGDYKFTTEGDEGKITLKLRKKANPEEPFYTDYSRELRLNATGDAGEIFNTGFYGYEADHQEFDKVEDLLVNGEIGDTRSICFTWRYLGLKDSKDIRNKIYTTATGIELIDNGFKAGVKPEKNSSSDDEEVDDVTEEEIIMLEAEMDDIVLEDEEEVATAQNNKSNVSSAEIDKFLDDYEKVMDSAIKFYKKANSGDASAMAEYASYMKKFNDMQKRAESWKLNDMSASQMARLERILLKYSQSLQSF